MSGTEAKSPCEQVAMRRARGFGAFRSPARSRWPGGTAESDGLTRKRNTKDENRRLPRLSGPGLVLRYGAFAVAAMIANLAAQRLVFATVGEGIQLGLALVAGTGVGLILKYMLDKKWIFFDRVRPAVQEARRFSLYTLTGVTTTLLFWATESGFWLFWHHQMAREIGAVLGLTAGYVIKYHLDRRFVFRA